MSELSEETPSVQWLLQACRDFNLPVNSAADNFFAIGGTSITLMRLVARVEQELGVALEPEEILDAESMADIAVVLSNREHATGTSPSTD